ncbi:MAG: alginate lyase family protein [Planctomycetota bacterium]|jgi:heparan-sulfate lyase
MIKATSLIAAMACFAVTHFASATELIAEQAGSSPSNDKALARKLADEERTQFMAAWNAGSLSRNSDLYGIEYVTSLLNLNYAGMDAVKAAVDSEHWGAAEDALLTYFKNRDYSDLNSPRGRLSRANDALAHYFPGNKNQPSGFTGADPEWPTSGVIIDGEVMTDKEWYYFLHRLRWWPDLAAAYHQTDEIVYFEEWLFEMVDYARDNYPLSSSSPWIVRRGMEAGNRIHNLKITLKGFIGLDQFDVKVLQYMLSSIHQNVEKIRTEYSAKGNHLIEEMNCVLQAGYDFPEFSKSEEWIDEVFPRLSGSIFNEMYEDGMNRQQVFHYHSGVYMQNYTDFYMSALEQGLVDRLPAGFHDMLVKMADVLLYSLFPDFRVNQFGDSWQMKSNTAFYSGAEPFRKMVAKYAPNYPYLEYAASEGASGTPPEDISRNFPISGFTFFRSDWDKNAVYMPIKYTEGHEWHTQDDNGTFDLYAYGRYFMLDSGAYVYASTDPEDIYWREWFRSTKVHNTLTVNNESILMDPTQLLWSDSEDLDALVFENTSYENMTHRRAVLFIDNKYFLIYDQSIANSTKRRDRSGLQNTALEGTVRAHFSLAPTDYEMNVADSSVKTLHPSGANLIVKSFDQGKAIEMQQEEGWISMTLARKEPRPAWSYAVEQTSRDKMVSFLTVLVPYPDSASEPQKIDASGDGLLFSLTVDDVRYEIELDLSAGQAWITIN